MTDAATIRTATSVASLAFGAVGALAPRALAHAYGAADPTPEHIYTVRLWAGATAAIGAIGLLPDGIDDRRFFQLGLALNVFDTVIGLTSQGTTRTRVLTTATAVVFAAAAGAGLAGD
ncbi:hypothetical protein [Nocardioides marmoribigeumensis]|uniref:DUF4267 domain-containing protein n=1 Tax=Nocardioides marmoribigeumensis TaxID=433649 RepID=A0ABU2BY61_9ACTN|nr:hypothetical protein [Nocardioides marmoribigeumensis]MDR7363336.1 hypothetical protein [Nocardioides marmoribigeumensis]